MRMMIIVRMMWSMTRWDDLEHGPDDPRVPADRLRVAADGQEVSLHHPSNMLQNIKCLYDRHCNTSKM